MTEANTVKVGMTKKTYGTKGELKLSIKEAFIEDVLQVDVAFLKMQGKLVPYFIEHFDFSNHLLVKFEEVDSPESATKLTSKDFYIKKEAVKLSEKEDETTVLNKLVGFKVRDEVLGLIGPILDLLEMPQQLLAIVDYKGREVMIPLHENLVSEIDEDQRIIIMKLPEGLLTIN